MTIKVAVIGVGSMGRNHARVYWEMPSAELVAIADTDEKLVTSLAARFGAKAYTDFREMLDKERPEAVTIAVPTSLHLEVATEVIRRGIHLLIEKPIALTIEDGELIIQEAKKNNCMLMIGHIERFNPAVIELKQRIAKGELGHIFQIDARRLGPFPIRISDVGVVVDLAVHDLDIMRYVTAREVVRVYAETAQRVHSLREDLLTSLIRFDNGIIGTLNINWLTPTKIRELDVLGECGLFHVNYLTQDLYLYRNATAGNGDWDTMKIFRGVSEGEMIRFSVNKKEPLRSEQDAFFAAIHGEGEIPVRGEDGLSVLRLVQALVNSGIEHHTIEF